MKGGRRGGLRASRHREEGGHDEDKRTCLGGGIQPLSGGGGIFKSAAVAVLRLERKLMTTGDITKVALERGLIKCQGKTPEATMASALYTDVKRKQEKSVFTRPQEGLFGLREWIAEGFFPEGWVGPTNGLGLAPFKKRGSPLIKQPRLSNSGRPSRRSAPSWRDADSELDEDAELVNEELVTADETAAEEEMHDMEETEEEAEEEEEEEEEEDKESPRPRGGRAGRRARARPGPASRARPALPPSEPDHLESPLHMLGEAAEMTEPGPSAGALAAGEGGGLGRQRRRPTHIQVPVSALAADGPKSPLVDSLAALHEIATSPQTYAPAGLLDSSGPVRRRNSRSSGGGWGLVNSGGRARQTTPTLASPASLYHDLEMSSLGGPLINYHSMLSPMLASPRLLNLAEGLPNTPDALAAALHSAGLGRLISPGAMLYGPRLHDAQAGLRPMAVNFAPMAAAAGSAAAQRAAAMRTADGSLTPDGARAELEEIGRVRKVVERLEARMGSQNPQVGKTWLSLARMYQHLQRFGPGRSCSGEAKDALARAQAVCQQLGKQCGMPLSASCVEAFDYLASRMQPGVGGDAANNPPSASGEQHRATREPDCSDQKVIEAVAAAVAAKVPPAGSEEGGLQQSSTPQAALETGAAPMDTS